MNKDELDEMLITEQNDVYVYFAMIERVKPKRVLDVGMYLKRIGAVCRQVCDCEVSAEVVLHALDIWSESFPVYEKVYDHIFDADDLPMEPYDLITAFYLPEAMQQPEIFLYLLELGKQIVVEDSEKNRVFLQMCKEISQVTLDGKKQYILASLR